MEKFSLPKGRSTELGLSQILSLRLYNPFFKDSVDIHPNLIKTAVNCITCMFQEARSCSCHIYITTYVSVQQISSQMMISQIRELILHIKFHPWSLDFDPPNPQGALSFSGKSQIMFLIFFNCSLQDIVGILPNLIFHYVKVISGKMDHAQYMGSRHDTGFSLNNENKVHETMFTG